MHQITTNQDASVVSNIYYSDGNESEKSEMQQSNTNKITYYPSGKGMENNQLYFSPKIEYYSETNNKDPPKATLQAIPAEIIYYTDDKNEPNKLESLNNSYSSSSNNKLESLNNPSPSSSMCYSSSNNKLESLNNYSSSTNKLESLNNSYSSSTNKLESLNASPSSSMCLKRHWHPDGSDGVVNKRRLHDDEKTMADEDVYDDTDASSYSARIGMCMQERPA